MSVVNHHVVHPSSNAVERQWSVIVWDGMRGADTGSPVRFVPYADRSVQVTGIFESDLATVYFEGSNDGVNWGTLRDPFGQPIEISDTQENACISVLDICAYVRPRVANGGLSALNVYLLVKY